MRIIVALSFLILVVGCSTTTSESLTVNHIAFGSCLKQDKPAPILDVINEHKPQIFMFLGDNIYGDTEDMSLLKKKYAMLTGRPEYKTLDKQSQILATWDDHDYGANDSGMEYTKKTESQQIFLDVFKEPKDSIRRHTAGIYTSYMYGPVDKRVQIIVIDNRYFRTSLTSGERKEKGGRYIPTTDSDATMLGEDQWAWLNEELSRDAKVRIIVGGTQFLREHNGYEAWANFPAELDKLVNTIKDTQANGVVFLSGDTHWAELTRRKYEDCYPLYDFTSSGLTEVWRYISPNKYRLGAMAYLGANFGEVKINWQAKDPIITFKATDAMGKIRFTHDVRLSKLQFN